MRSVLVRVCVSWERGRVIAPRGLGAMARLKGGDGEKCISWRVRQWATKISFWRGTVGQREVLKFVSALLH